MLISPDQQESLAAAGLSTLAQVMSFREVELFRALPDRDNGWFWLHDTIGERKRCWLKRHRASTFRVWLRRYLNGEASASDGTYEAQMSARCQSAGVATPIVVSAGKSQDVPWRAESFVITQHVPGQQADHLLQAQPNLLAEVIEPTAALLRRLHAAKLYHRDLYWCHLFIDRQAGSSEITCRLIDLQRMKSNPWFGWRWQIKDLAQFLVSAPANWTPQTEQAWFRVYFAGEPTMFHRLTIALAKLRAWFYWLKDHRKNSTTRVVDERSVNAEAQSKAVPRQPSDQAA